MIPSDDAPAVLAHGATDVEATIVSMSARSPDAADAQYIEWHVLDHLPEQYRISGLRNGTRWVSTPSCRAVRAAASPRFDAVDHVVQYLFAPPVSSAISDFFGLGADLAAVGRIPARLPAVELAGYRLAGRAAAARVLVGADVLPWRPVRGVYLLIEQSEGTAPEALADIAGVAGVWSYRGTDDLHARLASTKDLHLAVCYLDDDAVTTAQRIAPLLKRRRGPEPLLAAPFEPVAPWRWEAALP